MGQRAAGAEGGGVREAGRDGLVHCLTYLVTGLFSVLEQSRYLSMKTSDT